MGKATYSLSIPLTDLSGINEFLDLTLDAIIKTVKSRYKDKKAGKTLGDGKILITPLEECIRISTGERGSEAI